MHLLIITRAYGQNAGGMERLSFEMVETLKSSPKLDVTVIRPKNSPSKKRFARLGTSLAFMFLRFPQIISAAHKSDHIHLGDPLLSKIGWIIKALLKKPVSVTVHGLDILEPNPLYQLYLKLYFDNLSTYFPISQHVKNLLQERHVKNQIKILTPGIYDNFYSPSKTRAELDQLIKTNTQNKIVLITTGRLVERKGHAWFIQNVLPQLPDNYLYVIAGTGPEQETIANLDGGVVIFGKVSHENLKILYNTADAFVQPNIQVNGDAEGFGLVLLEAASCGMPVFASNLDGIPGAIHHNKNGTLLEPQNHQVWIDALNNFSPHKNFTARNYTLENFSWPNLKSKYVQAFTSLYK